MNLKQFDISKISDNAFCLCIGRRNTGKSTLLSRLVEEKQTTSVKDTLVMCGTQEEHDMYSKLDHAVINNGYRQDILHTYMTKQNTALRTEEKETVCVVLDNLEYEDIWKDVCVRQLVMNGRCMRMFLCCSSSSIFFVPPSVRYNIDYVFLFKETDKDNLDKIYKSFGGRFETYEKFCEAFDTCTKEPYGCMVIDNTRHSHRIEDAVYRYYI